MSATKEEIATENALYERLTLALTESLTNLSSEDLTKWGLRSALFRNLDQQIDAVIESSRGREQIARHHLCVLAFKIVNRLLGKIDAGETDRQYQKRLLSRIAAAARRTNVVVRGTGGAPRFSSAFPSKHPQNPENDDPIEASALKR